MEYLLFVAWLVFFAWLVTRTSFFTASGLSRSQLVILFLLKVIVGIFYGWVGLYYGSHAQMLDTWFYHYSSIEEYKLLGSNPQEYFTNLFHNPYPDGLLNFFGGSDSYWNDLKGNIFIKLLSVFDVFSYGHYYINVTFYSYLTLFGPIAFYRVMADVFPGKKIIILLATFFVPSFFYWTSGLHKEGLIFVAISLIIFHIYFGYKEKRFGLKRWLGIGMGLLLLLLLRNFLLAIMIPAVLAWILANKWPHRALACFAGVYIFFAILFFTLRYINPHLDFPDAVASKQQDFIETIGNSSIPIKKLQPTVISFVKNIPQAITLSSVRPYPSDINNLLALAAAIETDLILFLFLLSLFWRQKNRQQTPIVVYFCLFFSFSLLMGVGFSVNNLGAIVRYRSIITPLLFVLICTRLNWNKIDQLLFRNIKNQNNIN